MLKKSDWNIFHGAANLWRSTQLTTLLAFSQVIGIPVKMHLYKSFEGFWISQGYNFLGCKMSTRWCFEHSWNSLEATTESKLHQAWKSCLWSGSIWTTSGWPHNFRFLVRIFNLGNQTSNPSESRIALENSSSSTCPAWSWPVKCWDNHSLWLMKEYSKKFSF